MRVSSAALAVVVATIFVVSLQQQRQSVGAVAGPSDSFDQLGRQIQEAQRKLDEAQAILNRLTGQLGRLSGAEKPLQCAANRDETSPAAAGGQPGATNEAQREPRAARRDDSTSVSSEQDANRAGAGVPAARQTESANSERGGGATAAVVQSIHPDDRRHGEPGGQRAAPMSASKQATTTTFQDEPRESRYSLEARWSDQPSSGTPDQTGGKYNPPASGHALRDLRAPDEPLVRSAGLETRQDDVDLDDDVYGDQEEEDEEEEEFSAARRQQGTNIASAFASDFDDQPRDGDHFASDHLFPVPSRQMLFAAQPQQRQQKQTRMPPLLSDPVGTVRNALPQAAGGRQLVDQLGANIGQSVGDLNLGLGQQQQQPMGQAVADGKRAASGFFGGVADRTKSLLSGARSRAGQVFQAAAPSPAAMPGADGVAPAGEQRRARFRGLKQLASFPLAHRPLKSIRSRIARTQRNINNRIGELADRVRSNELVFGATQKFKTHALPPLRKGYEQTREAVGMVQDGAREALGRVRRLGSRRGSRGRTSDEADGDEADDDDDGAGDGPLDAGQSGAATPGFTVPYQRAVPDMTGRYPRVPPVSEQQQFPARAQQATSRTFRQQERAIPGGRASATQLETTSQTSSDGGRSFRRSSSISSSSSSSSSSSFVSSL